MIFDRGWLWYRVGSGGLMGFVLCPFGGFRGGGFVLLPRGIAVAGGDGGSVTRRGSLS